MKLDSTINQHIAQVELGVVIGASLSRWYYHYHFLYDYHDAEWQCNCNPHPKHDDCDRRCSPEEAMTKIGGYALALDMTDRQAQVCQESRLVSRSLW